MPFTVVAGAGDLEDVCGAERGDRVRSLAQLSSGVEVTRLTSRLNR